MEVGRVDASLDKVNAISMLVSLVTAILEMDDHGEWGSILKGGSFSASLPEPISLALARIGKLMPDSERERFNMENNIMP